MNSKLQNILTAVKLLQGLGVELLGEKDITVSESAYASMFGSYHGRTQADEGRWYIYTVVGDFWIGTITDKLEQYVGLEEQCHD